MPAIRYLADTHILLWSLANDARLKTPHRKILNSDAEVFFSAASIWEISIKKSIGNLQAPDGLAGILKLAGYSPLAITPSHAEAAADLPRHHTDPFDRLLAAQAAVEGLVLITADKNMPACDVRIV